MSDAHVASPSAPADPSWFTELVSPPASVETAPIPEPVSPVDSGEPTPAVEPPVEAEPAEPVIPSELVPPPDPEVERLKRQVAEFEQDKQRREQEQQRAQAAAARLESRQEYFAKAREQAANIDDVDERDVYWQEVLGNWDEQQEAHREQEREQQKLMEVVLDGLQKFPDHLGAEHGLSPEQVTYIRLIGEQQLDPMAKGAAMSVMAQSFKAMNQAAPTADQTRATATQALAERAAAEVRESGVTATGGIAGASPLPASKPVYDPRPGSEESLGALARFLTR